MVARLTTSERIGREKYREAVRLKIAKWVDAVEASDMSPSRNEAYDAVGRAAGVTGTAIRAYCEGNPPSFFVAQSIEGKMPKGVK